MWTPFGIGDDRVTITKSSLLKYSKSHNKFRKQTLINDFFYIYKADEKNHKDRKKIIIEQVENKLNYLIEKGFLRKEGDFIFINKKK